MKKTIAMLLAALLVSSCFLTACSCRIKRPGAETPEPQTSAAAATDGPGTTYSPLPTGEPAERTAEDDAFEELANEVFIDIITSDGYAFHQFVVNEGSFGITEADVERGWGSYSYESHAAGCEENAGALERLGAIDRSRLIPANRIAYDNLMEVLLLSKDTDDYFYYNEPLTPFNGEHTMLPLMMTMYEINTKDDIENYLYLLADMPRYLGELEQFEIEKADHGLFMTENALDQVITSCETYTANGGEDFFLLSSFEDTLNELPFELSAAEKEDYIARNRGIVLNEIVPAYSSLAATLESLRPHCRAMEGAAARSPEEKRYFELQIRNEAAVDMSCADMAESLDSLAQELLSRLIALVMADYSLADSFGQTITSGVPETDVEYLLELIAPIYPEIPAQSIDYITIPEAVAEDFSPAAYLISAFDDPSRNVVMFNPSADNRTQLFTLAHECFPGHLYQTQYFRSSGSIPLMQQAIAPSGYLEGWAVFSELMIASRADKYNANACLLDQYNDIILNILVPGYISIRVNCDGWTKADIKDYLKLFSLDEDEYVDILYEYAVDVPLYFFNYAMGFTNTMRIYEHVDPQNDAELRDFLAAYLGYGPCYFDILNEKFGVN